MEILRITHGVFPHLWGSYRLPSIDFALEPIHQGKHLPLWARKDGDNSRLFAVAFLLLYITGYQELPEEYSSHVVQAFFFYPLFSAPTLINWIQQYLTDLWLQNAKHAHWVPDIWHWLVTPARQQKAWLVQHR